jgi:hypothetical protein
MIIRLEARFLCSSNGFVWLCFGFRPLRASIPHSAFPGPPPFQSAIRNPKSAIQSPPAPSCHSSERWNPGLSSTAKYANYAKTSPWACHRQRSPAICPGHVIPVAAGIRPSSLPPKLEARISKLETSTNDRIPESSKRARPAALSLPPSPPNLVWPLSHLLAKA